MKKSLASVSVASMIGVVGCSSFAVYEALRYQNLSRGEEIAIALHPGKESVSSTSIAAINQLPKAAYVLNEVDARHRSAVAIHESLVRTMRDSRQAAFGVTVAMLVLSICLGYILVVSEMIRRAKKD
jgi:hypothetical protein